ncbi:MAG: MBL fold metallo-hydrolase [Candidatus Cryptobacteroides sp.]
MKKFIFSAIAMVAAVSAFAQGPRPGFQEKTVYKGDDLEIRQIDEHTWHGNGNKMSMEAIYIIEGTERALVIDAGTEIKDYDKIIAGITSKPVTLVATHVHPDHTGSAVNYFDEIYINAADMVNVANMMGDYKGQIKYLADGEIINLGGREIEVIFTPGHTPGSTTFFDKAAGYGFSGDSFGSGNLLLTTNFSTLLLTCQRTLGYMQKNNIEKLYPGHYMGVNVETQQRIADMLQMSRDVLDGKLKGDKNPRAMLGLDNLLVMHGVRINYADSAVK